MEKIVLEKPVLKKRRWDHKVKVSQRFVTALAIVSILEFTGITSKTLFAYNLDAYLEALWMFIIGIGLSIEIQLKKLKLIPKQGLTRDNITNLITVIIGVVAIIAGIFSFPSIRIENPSFLAVKGIISIIAIVIIIIQTWIIDSN